MFSNQAVLSACLITLLGLVSTRLKLRRREQSNGAFLYLHQSQDRHGGTYKASDDFPAQTNRCQTEFFYRTMNELKMSHGSKIWVDSTNIFIYHLLGNS